eukprot:2580755-Amphidinium_carterae.1
MEAVVLFFLPGQEGQLFRRKTCWRGPQRATLVWDFGRHSEDYWICESGFSTATPALRSLEVSTC